MFFPPLLGGGFGAQGKFFPGEPPVRVSVGPSFAPGPIWGSFLEGGLPPGVRGITGICLANRTGDVFTRGQLETVAASRKAHDLPRDRGRAI